MSPAAWYDSSFDKLVHLQCQAVFGVAELLELLQQSDEPADRAGAAAREAGSRTAPATCAGRAKRAAEPGRRPDTAQATGALAGEARQAGASEKPTAS